jgi:hypothetical protein
MKKLCTLLVLQFIMILAMAQGCLPDGITFTTQAEIDSFQVNYPGCTEIEGDVHIYGSQNVINNLHGLSTLTTIGGSLLIYFCDDLISLTGLDNLTSIGGLYLYADQSLTSFEGLGNLNSIGADLNIQWCGSLQSFDGFNNLTTIDGSLNIYMNGSLTSLAGLDNIASNSIRCLYIAGNHVLSNCNVESICGYLASPGGSINIYNNAPGCNNPAEVANSCGIQLACMPFGNYYVTTQAEVDSFDANYPGCHNLPGGLAINGDNITNLTGLSHLKSIEGSLSFISNDSLLNYTGLDSLETIGGTLQVGYWEGNEFQGLTSFTGLEKLSAIGGSLSIIANESLVSLTGLGRLKSIGTLGDLEVVNNNALLSLSGMDSLTVIGQDLHIGGNNLLSDISGLGHITSVGREISVGNNNSLLSLAGLDNIDVGSVSVLNITSNASLSTCDVKSVCDYLANPDASVTISDNAPGCNSREEVEAACGVDIKEISKNESLEIYPNPASGFILITASEKSSDIQISILSINGREILNRYISGNSVWIDISGFPAGLYIIRATGDKTIMAGRFVKY